MRYIRCACCTSSKKKVVDWPIIADRETDRNFRYAGKKGLPGKAVREFPA